MGASWLIEQREEPAIHLAYEHAGTDVTSVSDRSVLAQSETTNIIAVLAVLAAVFMVYVDLSVVLVALPTLERGLGATFSQAEWVIAGYQVGYATVLMGGGRLGDMLGCRTVFVGGMLLFLVASIGCGLSPSASWLDVWRVVQGVAAGLIYPQALPVLRGLHTDRHRQIAIAGLGAAQGFAVVVGPLLGGAIIALGFFHPDGAWRPIFLINVPISLFGAVAGWISLPKRKPGVRHKLDGVGLALISAALLFVLLPLVQAPDSGWTRSSAVLFSASVLCGAGFLYWEVRRHRRGDGLLVEMELVKDPTLFRGSILLFVLFLGVPSAFFVLTIFLQFGLGYSALQTGLTAMPYAIGTAFAAGISVRFMDKLGKSSLYVGAGLLIVGTVMFSRVLGELTLTSGDRHLLLPIFICGLGVGATIPPLMALMLASVKVDDPGGAAGVGGTVQQVGGATGVAVIGVLFFSLLGSHATGVLNSQSAAVGQKLVAVGVTPSARPAVLADYDTCFIQAARDKTFTGLPASCKVLDWAKPDDGVFYKVREVLESAGSDGRASVMGKTTSRLAYLDAIVFLVALLFVFFLPKPNLANLSEESLFLGRVKEEKPPDC